MDQLNLLNQQIAELQEVEDHLRTRNLRESISAKTSSGTEPPVSAKPSKASKADPEKAKPASVPPVKAPPLTGSAGRSVSLAQQAPKSSAPVKPASVPPVKAPPLRSSSGRPAPRVVQGVLRLSLLPRLR